MWLEPQPYSDRVLGSNPLLPPEFLPGSLLSNITLNAYQVQHKEDYSTIDTCLFTGTSAEIGLFGFH